MTFLAYNQNIPDGPHNPSADWPLMQTNTNSTFNWVEEDHFGFLNNQGGWHNLLHIPPQENDPAEIGGVGQFYTKNYTVGDTTDTQLYFRTGLGGISQLTGNAASLNGYNWIGGALLQWGFNTATSSGSFASGQATGQITFPIAFPTTCFLVLPVPYFNSSSSPNSAGSVNIAQNTLSTTIFQWAFNSNSHQYTGFYWMAIGN